MKSERGVATAVVGLFTAFVAAVVLYSILDALELEAQDIRVFAAGGIALTLVSAFAGVQWQR